MTPDHSGQRRGIKAPSFGPDNENSSATPRNRGRDLKKKNPRIWGLPQQGLNFEKYMQGPALARIKLGAR